MIRAVLQLRRQSAAVRLKNFGLILPVEMEVTTMKRLSARLLILCACLALLSGCGSSPLAPDSSTASQGNSQDPIRVACLLPGSASDRSWSQFGYEALMQVQEELGAEVVYSENIADADLLPALRDYAAKGYHVIFGHGGQFQGAMEKVAPEYPDTEFIVICGANPTGSNVTAADNAPWQYGYAYGWMASQISQTKKVGYVGALEGIDVTNNFVGSMKDGLKSKDPDCQISVIYLDDNNDVSAAKEAATALAAAGCDVILHELNRGSQGVVDYCKEHDIYTLGRSTDDVAYAPDQVLTFCSYGWTSKYVSLTRMAVNGELEGGTLYFGYHTAPDAPGFEFIYDKEHAWNPRAVTDEMLEAFQTEVVDLFIADPIRSYTAQQAAGGTF